ncbi:MAG: hypothetical protein IJU20_00110 [Clostridia bacterium]|nr:hypothetical protein [Clostridia bacterium]
METNYQVFVLSNTHWDREWYMSHERYLVRLTSLCDRLLALMEKEPGYIFLFDGQCAALTDYLDVRPEQTGRVRRLVREGRLLVGPWFTQPLETIASGEALIRNLSLGRRIAKDLGGVMPVSYMIDEFGHAAQTPQLLNGFGIRDAIAWRGIPKHTRNVFNWYAPDGSAVFMFYSNAGYGEATNLPQSVEDFTETIDGAEIQRRGLKSRIEALRRLREPNAAKPIVMWLNGIDHSFAQPDLLQVLEKARELDPSLCIHQATPMEFTQAMRDAFAKDGETPADSVTGELMYAKEDILESTHSNHVRQKMRHYQVEHLLSDYAEPADVLGCLTGGEDMGYSLRRAWRYVLENHAHDSLGCTSVDEVYEQVMARYTCAHDVADQAAEANLRHFMRAGGKDSALYVYNFSSYPQCGVRKMCFILPEGMDPGASMRLISPDGTEVRHTVLSTKPVRDVRYNPAFGHPTHTAARQIEALVLLPEVPPIGWLKLKLEKGEPDIKKRNRVPFCLERSPLTLENEYLTVCAAPDGTLDVTDRQTGRTYPGQLLFEDEGEAGDSYVHIPPRSNRKIYSSGCPHTVAILWDNPMGSCMEIRHEMEIPADLKADGSARTEECVRMNVVTRVTLLAQDPVLHFSVSVDNRARQHRLRVLFPTGLNTAEESFGLQPFDLTRRKIHEESDDEVREQPYATHPMQGLCGTYDGENGAAVCAPGLYEYECTDDDSRSLAVTLLRANNIFGYSSSFARSPLYSLEASQVPGRVDFSLDLLFFRGNPEEQFPRLAPLLRPLRVLPARAPEDSVMPDYSEPEAKIPGIGSILHVDSPRLVLTACKRSDLHPGALTVRVYNCSPEAQSGKLHFTFPGLVLQKACATEADEEKTKKLDVRDGVVSLRLRGYEIRTLLLYTGKEPEHEQQTN